MRRTALALILGCLLLVAGVSAIDGYEYYQTIEYAACGQGTYQQDLVIHRSAGTAYNETAGGLETWHLYVGDHCREDYGDVRFTNSAGAELAYYLWPDYSSESARFAVRLEGAASAGTLTAHYGNPTAATTSDPSALPTVYTETGSHTYTVPDGVSSVAVLIVGGGGGGAGRDVSGGGGAGGLIFRPAYTVTPGSTLSVYVGAGGSGGVDTGSNPILDSTGENGESTTFGDLIALGGGGGGYYRKPGVSGGSGGGAGREASPNVGGSSLQPLSESGGYGNAGGMGSGGSTNSHSGGGGGGAGEPGVNGVINQAGRGGHGLSAVTIEGTEYSFAAFFGGLGVGQEVNGDLYFAGGGGGTTHRSGTANVGIGGYGGGGSGATPNGVPGTPNTGGGGGASRGTSNHGGAGGSGVVLIRAYSTSPPAAITFSGEQETAAPPVTTFTASPTAGLAPLTVQFTDTSTASPTSWSWTFGDGNTSTAQNPQHTYTEPGTYTVTLTATNEYGSDTETKTDYITVYGPVTAQFTANVTGGTAPLAVQFTDLSTGGPTAWSWSFGDGNTSAAQNPVHTYTTAGTHTVTLTASHPYDSDTETKTAYITVAVLQPFPGLTLIPRDLTGNGLYTDINGNNRLDYNDLTVFFQHLAWAKTAQPIACFDFNGNGWLDYNDVITLFSIITEEHP